MLLTERVTSITNQMKSRPLFFNLKISSTVRLLLLILLAIGFVNIFASGGVAAQSADIVVAEDGSGDYTSIQDAVDNATENDYIEVKSGTYEEDIFIPLNISIIAPNSAIIANTSSIDDGTAVSWQNPAAPKLEGFNFTGWDSSISTGGPDARGDWEVRDSTINGGSCAVCAAGTEGEWTLENVTIRNAGTAVSAYDSNGDWVIQNSKIRESDEILAYESSGDWVIDNVTVRDGVDNGINVGNSSGDWTINNTSINQTSSDGLFGENTGGNWTLDNVSISDTSDMGIEIDGSSGDWTMRDTHIKNTGADGINGEHTGGNWTLDNVAISDANDIGIEVDGSTGNWLIKNTNVSKVGEEGIDMANSKGDVEIIGTAIRNTGAGNYNNAIRIEDSVGNWTIRNTIIANISGEGIDAYNQPESSQAVIQDLTVTDTQNHGVNFYNSSGDWKVVNSNIYNNDWSGIEASNSTGDWNVSNTTIKNADDSLIGARRATGTWKIHESKLVTADIAVNATEAIKGNASYNYWGSADGPSGDFNGSGTAAFGNVTVEPYYNNIDLTRDPVVYIGSREESSNGAIYAVNAETGKQSWEIETNRPVESGLIVVNGTLYGNDDEKLYAIDAEEGTKQWELNFGSNGLYSSPTVVENTVYILSYDGGIYAINATTGKEQWNTTLSNSESLFGAPAVQNDSVFISAENQNANYGNATIYSFDKDTGNKKWEFNAQSGDDEIGDGVTAIGDKVFAGAGNSLYAINATQGTEIWNFTTLGEPSVPPTASNGIVYIQSVYQYEEDGETEFNQTFYAIDSESGDDIWKEKDAAGTDGGAPTLSNGTVFFGGGQLYARNATTGDKKWSHFSGTPRSSPTVADGVVYVGTDNKKVVAVDAGSGDKYWEFNETGSYVVSSPTIVQNSFSGNSAGSRIQLETLNHHDKDTSEIKLDMIKSPIAIYDYTPNSPDTGTSVTFDASNSRDPDGVINSYEWDFNNDGNTDKTGVSPEYTYNNAGSYDVTLTITDNDGVTKTTKQTITVSTSSSDTSGDSDGGTGSGGGGGAAGGGGGAGSGASSEQGPPSIADVQSTLSLVDPTSNSETQIQDTDPDTSGVTVTIEETPSVQSVNFNSDDVTGSVEVTVYSDPPQVVRDQVAQSINGADAMAAGDEDSDDDNEDSGASSTKDGGSSNVNTNVVSVVDISPTSNQAEDTSAEVTLSVSGSDVENPQELTVFKETYDFDAQETTWSELETSIENTGEEQITVSAPVDDFSLFAVTEVDQATPQQQQADTQDGQQTDQQQDDSGPSAVVAIGGLLALLAIVGIGYFLRQN